MDRRAFFGVLVGLGVSAPEPPALTDSDRLLIDTTQVMGTIVGSCDRLSLYGKYSVQKDLVTKFIEQHYVPWTVDWGQLPAKLTAKSP